MQALRFFVGEPVWTPYNRPHDHLPARYELISIVWPMGKSEDLSNLIFLISICRGQYIKTFLEKDVANNAVDAAA